MVASANTRAYALKMVRHTSSRLGPGDWLDAGLAVLSETGPWALKAEPLAARLGVSKGSFYWHFRDVPAFQDAVLAAWETDAVSRVTGAGSGAPTAVAGLRALAQAMAGQDSGSGLPAAEPAIRGWARGHAPARAAVERVDAARLTLLRDLLAETGIANPEMARILYAAAIGMGTLGATGPEDREAAMGSLVDLVLALR